MARNNDLRNAMAQVVHDDMYALGNRHRSALIQLDFQTALETLHYEAIKDAAYMEGYLRGRLAGRLEKVSVVVAPTGAPATFKADVLEME